jgi:hypothetical protein
MAVVEAVALILTGWLVLSILAALLLSGFLHDAHRAEQAVPPHELDIRTWVSGEPTYFPGIKTTAPSSGLTAQSLARHPGHPGPRPLADAQEVHALSPRSSQTRSLR